MEPIQASRSASRPAFHIAFGKDEAPGKCSLFVCFGWGVSSERGLSKALGRSLNESCDSTKRVITAGLITGNEIRGCLKSNSKRDSLEHCIVVSEGEEPRESLEEVQTLRAGMEWRKVQWTDTCGNDLFEIREFETSDKGLSDDEPGNEDFRKCECDSVKFCHYNKEACWRR